MGEGTIFRISGPIVVSKETYDIVMNEEVRVGDEELIGEVIEINIPCSFLIIVRGRWIPSKV
ncbi:hypothetical protein ES703_85413 [subsurface metagenome]